MRQRGKEIVREREADRCTLARKEIKGYSDRQRSVRDKTRD
jgi:hypothetical protein